MPVDVTLPDLHLKLVLSKFKASNKVAKSRINLSLIWTIEHRGRRVHIVEIGECLSFSKILRFSRVSRTKMVR